MQAYLNLIAEGEPLTQDQAEEAMHRMMQGQAEPEHVAAFLMGLRARGETTAELVGFTRVMRAYAVPVRLDDPHAIDLCGTGGDRSGTFNISTAAAFVCAGAGVTVAKHGNRSISSKAGSADVMRALGVEVELGPDGVETCLREAGIAFIYAPLYHPALKHVMPIRRTLGVRTFFNILGPLCNPAGVRRQLVGAFSEEVARSMATILAELDAEQVLAVHAQDGLDEISVAAPTRGFFYSAREQATERDAYLKPLTIRPEQHGLARFPLDAIRGGTAEDNAALIRRVLDGEWGPHRVVVLLNAAYGLYVSGRFNDLTDCFDAARESIDSGAARAALDRLVAASHDVRPAA